MSEVDKKLKIFTDLEAERKGQVAHNHGLIDSLFQDLSKLKENYRITSEKFVSSLSDLNQRTNERVENLIREDTKLEKLIEKNKIHIETTDSEVS